MSILVNKDSRIVCQGITGSQGTFHTEQCIDYGTQVVAGVTPGKGGSEHIGVPVFNTMRDAVRETGVKKRCSPTAGPSFPDGTSLRAPNRGRGGKGGSPLD